MLEAKRREAARTPALLTTARYLGTLATVRCLGRRGVRVTVAASDRLAPAQWSRLASHVVRCRPAQDPETILEWLLEFGEREPGAVLHPTSDEMAWLIAKHADELRPFYALYAPAFAAVRALLDKCELYRASRAAGFRTPATFFPRTEREAFELGTHGCTFVVKPRTQVFYRSHAKGEVVSGAREVARAWRACHESPHAPSVRADAPDIDKPMLQELVPNDGVDSITGFVTHDFEVLAVRGARKILQRPRGLGVGVCFEAAPVDPSLVDKIAKLARDVGFFGAFEAELVAGHLIDFNPRYYGQLAFDVARGSPLPWMLHLAALGHHELVRREARAALDGDPSAFSDRVTLRVMLASHRLAGTLLPETERKWKHWLNTHDGVAVDAAIAADDPLPGIALALATIYEAARHPRGFWRSLQGVI